MKTHRTLTCALIIAAAASAWIVLAGCGSDDDGEKASAAEGFDSPYCVTARKWAVHELNGGGDGAYARGGPVALEKWWNEQLAYLKISLRQAPPVIRDAEAIFERAIRTRLTPVLTKYGFDPKRLEAEGSASEKPSWRSNPLKRRRPTKPALCTRTGSAGTGGEPPAAHVTFTASAAAKSYCEAVAAQQKGNSKVESSGFDPAVFRSYVTSDSFSEALDAQDATAPSEIAADVKADNEWARTRVLKVLEEFDYDVRRILREGSAEDLAVFTSWDPAIRKQDSRVTAYQEQVCGG